MTATRVRYTRRQVDHYQSDVEDWKRLSDAAERDYYVRERLIARANDLYGQIIDLDSAAQTEVLAGRIEYDPELDRGIQKLLEDWRRIGLDFLPLIEKAARESGPADGSGEFRRNLTEAGDVLTPDAVFFSGDELTRLRDAALAAHRAGDTEPMLP